MDEEVVPFGQNVQVVDPDVRGYVYSLVTALGGFNGEDAGKYALGDDALACLRDIKRWLKLYDEKNNRMDVARCLGESNLVNGDLIPILTLWWNMGQNSKYMSRIALACLELLVPLTWPLEIHSQMTVNHHRHMPYLQQAQVHYKRGLLSSVNAGLLRTVIKIGLPSMAVARSERTSRDEGILKLMLYLLRNIAIIAPDSRLIADGEEEETSRSKTINTFQEQDAFALLLTMCSNVGDDFNMQDVVLLEILFHIVKGVNLEKLFMDDEQRKEKRTDELGGLLQKESSLRREYAKNAPTRHGRFGTMIWVKRDDAKVSTVSGQDILKDGQATLHKMDQTKKWNKPQRGRKPKEISTSDDFSMPVHLSSTATKNLRMFVEEFLDSGFNPLFTHVRKAIEREADRVVPLNSRQFFHTVAWFLEAERARRDRQRQKRVKEGKSSKVPEPDSFGLIAGVLNQETFIFLNRSMQSSWDNKEWKDLSVEMRCFTQILLTVQEMAISPLDEDQEIAENIQSRIFYEETTHDRVLAILRGYKDQGVDYLDACTELAHVFLRMLEQYSKTNTDMQVRSKRRARRKAKQAESKAANGEGEEEDEGHASEDEEDEEHDAERVSRERKFDFTRFAAKFCNQKCVDTFVAFTGHYKELSTEQLKRAHRYFYRIAFKQEMTVLLFRVDIINLFYRMIKGPGALDSSQPIFREWEELVRQIIRRLTKKLEQRPALVTEMLFSKINSTVFYLEYGHEKQTVSVARKPAAELEVNPKEAKTIDEKIGITVAALVKDDQTNLAKWISEVLGSAADERESWEANEDARKAEGSQAPDAPNPMIAVKPEDDACRNAMFSNGKLRLLMTLVSLERLGVEDVPGASWIVPSVLSSKDIKHSKTVIDEAVNSPIPEDRDPREQLRRKGGGGGRKGNEDPTVEVTFGSDSEGEDDIPDGYLFPPNPRSKSNALDELKKKRKKKQKDEGDREPLDEETLEERRQSRLENARARQAKIKSDLFIHASDEDSDAAGDEEFFRLEEQRRKDQAERIKKALLTGDLGDKPGKKKGGRKRQSDEHNSRSTAAQSKRQRRRPQAGSNDGDSGSDDDILMAGMESAGSPRTTVNEDALATAMEDDLVFDDDIAFSRNRAHEDSGSDEDVLAPQPTAAPAGNEDEEDDEDAPPVPSRRRVRAGFVLESDSE